MARRDRGMSRAEARGYIRGRATAILTTAAERLLTNEVRLSEASQARVKAVATDLVIDQVIATVQQAQPAERVRRQAG